MYATYLYERMCNMASFSAVNCCRKMLCALLSQVVKIFIGLFSLHASGDLKELKKWTLRESVKLVFLPAAIYTVVTQLPGPLHAQASASILNFLYATLYTTPHLTFIYFLLHPGPEYVVSNCGSFLVSFRVVCRFVCRFVCWVTPLSLPRALHIISNSTFTQIP